MEGCVFYANDGDPWVHPWKWMHGGSNEPVGPKNVLHASVGCGKGGFKDITRPRVAVKSKGDDNRITVKASGGTLYCTDAVRPGEITEFPRDDSAARALYEGRRRRPAPVELD